MYALFRIPDLVDVRRTGDCQRVVRNRGLFLLSRHGNAFFESGIDEFGGVGAVGACHGDRSVDLRLNSLGSVVVDFFRSCRNFAVLGGFARDTQRVACCGGHGDIAADDSIVLCRQAIFRFRNHGDGAGGCGFFRSAVDCNRVSNFGIQLDFADRGGIFGGVIIGIRVAGGVDVQGVGAVGEFFPASHCDRSGNRIGLDIVFTKDAFADRDHIADFAVSGRDVSGGAVDLEVVVRGGRRGVDAGDFTVNRHIVFLVCEEQIAIVDAVAVFIIQIGEDHVFFDGDFFADGDLVFASLNGEVASDSAFAFEFDGVFSREQFDARDLGGTFHIESQDVFFGCGVAVISTHGDGTRNGRVFADGQFVGGVFAAHDDVARYGDFGAFHIPFAVCGIVAVNIGQIVGDNAERQSVDCIFSGHADVAGVCQLQRSGFDLGLVGGVQRDREIKRVFSAFHNDVTRYGDVGAARGDVRFAICIQSITEIELVAVSVHGDVGFNREIDVADRDFRMIVLVTFVCAFCHSRNGEVKRVAPAFHDNAVFAGDFGVDVLNLAAFFGIDVRAVHNYLCGVALDHVAVSVHLNGGILCGNGSCHIQVDRVRSSLIIDDFTVFDFLPACHEDTVAGFDLTFDGVRCTEHRDGVRSDCSVDFVLIGTGDRLIFAFCTGHPEIAVDVQRAFYGVAAGTFHRNSVRGDRAFCKAVFFILCDIDGVDGAFHVEAAELHDIFRVAVDQDVAVCLREGCSFLFMPLVVFDSLRSRHDHISGGELAVFAVDLVGVSEHVDSGFGCECSMVFDGVFVRGFVLDGIREFRSLTFVHFDAAVHIKHIGGGEGVEVVDQVAVSSHFEIGFQHALVVELVGLGALHGDCRDRVSFGIGNLTVFADVDFRFVGFKDEGFRIDFECAVDVEDSLSRTFRCEVLNGKIAVFLDVDGVFTRGEIKRSGNGVTAAFHVERIVVFAHADRHTVLIDRRVDLDVAQHVDRVVAFAHVDGAVDFHAAVHNEGIVAFGHVDCGVIIEFTTAVDFDAFAEFKLVFFFVTGDGAEYFAVLFDVEVGERKYSRRKLKKISFENEATFPGPIFDDRLLADGKHGVVFEEVDFFVDQLIFLLIGNDTVKGEQGVFFDIERETVDTVRELTVVKERFDTSGNDELAGAGDVAGDGRGLVAGNIDRVAAECGVAVQSTANFHGVGVGEFLVSLAFAHDDPLEIGDRERTFDSSLSEGLFAVLFAIDQQIADNGVFKRQILEVDHERFIDVVVNDRDGLCRDFGRKRIQRVDEDSFCVDLCSGGNGSCENDVRIFCVDDGISGDFAAFVERNRAFKGCAVNESAFHDSDRGVYGSAGKGCTVFQSYFSRIDFASGDLCALADDDVLRVES